MNLIMSSLISQPHFTKPASIPPTFPSRPRFPRVSCQKSAVGIDIGTTNSAVATVKGGKPAIITNAEGQRSTPSAVAYTENGELLVGEIAKKQAAINPENTFLSIRRIIGKKMKEIEDYDKEMISYKLVGDENGDVKVYCPAVGKEFTAEEISAQLVRKLVNDATSFLNETVNAAVITVPAYFNDSQRIATTKACQIAGLDVLQVIDEPCAASLAYGFDNKLNGIILVLDLGGSTFGVSVLQVGDGVFEVLSTSNDLHFGGDDFDKRIVNWIVENFELNEEKDLLKDKQTIQLLIEIAEAVKMELSTLSQTSISLPFLKATPDGLKNVEHVLTRVEFEDMCSDLLKRLKTPVETALKKSKISFEDIDQVILSGGSARILAVQDFVMKLTGKQPRCSVNPDELVALGAALQAEVLSMDGKASDMVLLDVTPLSIGIETLGGVVTKIIPKNTTLPISKSLLFSTAADAQTTVEVNVLVGERALVKDNKLLGSFRLDGIPPSPRGVPQLQLKFDIDTNGVLLVTALDKGTGKEKAITITGACTLPKYQVDEMVREAEEFADHDKENKDGIDTRNQANSIVYQTERHLEELGGKVPVHVKESVEAKLKELRDIVNSDGVNREIKNAIAALNHELMQLGQSIYNQSRSGDGVE